MRPLNITFQASAWDSERMLLFIIGGIGDGREMAGRFLEKWRQFKSDVDSAFIICGAFPATPMTRGHSDCCIFVAVGERIRAPPPARGQRLGTVVSGTYERSRLHAVRRASVANLLRNGPKTRFSIGSAYGSRTRVPALRGLCPNR